MPDRRHDQDDRVLLRRVLADPDGPAGRHAASDLLARYQRRIYLWCFRYARDHDRALDMAQEALMTAARGLSRLDPHADVGAWIFVVTRNRCLSELRRPSLLTDDEADPDAVASSAPDPETVLLDRLDEERTLDLIREHLEPRERQALWLRCFEKLPVDEITRVLRVEESTGARALLQRARRKLARALASRDAQDEGMEP